MSALQMIPLAAAGTTGNVTGASVQIAPTWNAIGFLFVAEAAGATPTVTYKFQGSLDGANWFDLGYITDASDNIAVTTRVRSGVGTTVGADVMFLSNPGARFYKFFRVVTTANTNVTFRAEAYPLG